MSLIETIVLKEHLQLFHACCPNCKHEFNPKLVITAGTELNLHDGNRGDYITVVNKADGFQSSWTILENIQFVWDKAKKLAE